MSTRQRLRSTTVRLSALILLAATAASRAYAEPLISRLTPPSNVFTKGDPTLPVVSRFLQGQRFDLQATIQPEEGQTITGVFFFVGGQPVRQLPAIAPATASGLRPGSVIATIRAFSRTTPGVHRFAALAIQSDRRSAVAEGNFEILRVRGGRPLAKNLIVLIGDGMGIAHRTAARLMLHGASQGKANGRLAMDGMPFTGMVLTHSLNSIVTDSSPGSACYSSGNKANNNQHGVFPDDTTDNFDNPRIELITEYFARTGGKSLGLVTTSDVFDATPAAWATHTQSRSAGTGICDQYLDDSGKTNLAVLMGGGRKWFLPNTELGSARAAANDYALPDELHRGWDIAPGAIDPERDLLGDFVDSGWTYAAGASDLDALPRQTRKLLGLFALSNMNVALDKIEGRRGNTAVVDDYGFPDQPMLDEMTEAALDVLKKNDRGFVLMVEAASIDKQAHNMDTERWILDTIEFDHAVAVCLEFAKKHGDTLVVVTADHECAGINIIGGSTVTDADLEDRSLSGGGIDRLRRNVVGTYERAGFPAYAIAEDGYPETTNVDRRMLIGYAANGDRYEDWRTNPQPLRDSQQPFNNLPPLSTYPGGPLNRDVAGNFLVTGQIHDPVAAHTGSDVPVSAYGPGAWQFVGVMDNTDVFFKSMAALLGAPSLPAELLGGDDDRYDK
jgi:alkaline phosphatase